MKRLKKRQIGRVVCTILQQLAITTPVNVVYSWGITKKTATQIKVSKNGRKRFIAALMMEVYGQLLWETIYYPKQWQTGFWLVH